MLYVTWGLFSFLNKSRQSFLLIHFRTRTSIPPSPPPHTHTAPLAVLTSPPRRKKLYSSMLSFPDASRILAHMWKLNRSLWHSNSPRQVYLQTDQTLWHHSESQLNMIKTHHIWHTHKMTTNRHYTTILYVTVYCMCVHKVPSSYTWVKNNKKITHDENTWVDALK